MKKIRTRFAPSPTGFLHIGGARTAIFCWAFAQHHAGEFVLRIEDTDLARSSPEAVEAILDAMAWLGLDYGEGPFYQTQRLDRYKEVIQQMLSEGTAYYCYTSKEELDLLRASQEQRKEKPRYDGRWRPEEGRELPAIPVGISPVVRFKNPKSGVVAWNDQVKGRVEFANSELDDLVIARSDGTPTYNFCVVVDDWDMEITHVIRGDDHVNNTPRQINILKALGADVPEYAHLSMILGDDGLKLSKRHGAVSVMQYRDDGFLPEAVFNYLARLGWSHGDHEIFLRKELVNWFDLDHINSSAAQFNTEKLLWINQHYIKQHELTELAVLVKNRLAARGIATESGPDLVQAVALYRERSNTLIALADAVEGYYVERECCTEMLSSYLTQEVRLALGAFAIAITHVNWDASAIQALMKDVVSRHRLKMPDLAMPIRILCTGQRHTPPVDAILLLIGRGKTVQFFEKVGFL